MPILFVVLTQTEHFAPVDVEVDRTPRVEHALKKAVVILSTFFLYLFSGFVLIRFALDIERFFAARLGRTCRDNKPWDSTDKESTSVCSRLEKSELQATGKCRLLFLSPLLCAFLAMINTLGYWKIKT